MFIDGGQIVEEGEPAKLLQEPESERLRDFLRRFRAAFI